MKKNHPEEIQIVLEQNTHMHTEVNNANIYTCNNLTTNATIEDALAVIISKDVICSEMVKQFPQAVRRHNEREVIIKYRCHNIFYSDIIYIYI